MIAAAFAVVLGAITATAPPARPPRALRTHVLAGPVIVRNAGTRLGDFEYVVLFRVDRDPLTVPAWLRSDAFVDPAERRGNVRIGRHHFADVPMSRPRRLRPRHGTCIAFEVVREHRRTVRAPVGARLMIALRLFDTSGRLGRPVRRTVTVEPGSPGLSDQAGRATLDRIGC
ncbi:hypothetical protein [Patulibacter defluvii]|uniref:hypothetical protein n=1 Tax=Patulibacter defluvii TaxID=3095358 RepID=UPI002A763F14|nr:hypothetical protein [Patulibacter sp. DM4]